MKRRKKSQRILAGILAIIVSIGLIGSGLYGYFYGGAWGGNSAAPVAAGNDYASLKARAEGLAKQAEANPNDVQLQKDLGNAYYDLAMAAQEASPNETGGDLKKAIEAYQNVLKSQKDVNVMVDLATAAFYAGDNDLADKMFKQAIAAKPDFYNALYNYGIFLSHAKNDWAGALKQWQAALALNPSAEDKQRLEALIQGAAGQLQGASGSAAGSSNNKVVPATVPPAEDAGSLNPALNGTASNPALNGGLTNPSTNSGK